MSTIERTTFLIIMTVGVIAPLLVDLAPRLRLPVVVLEIALGIVVGPQVLHWAQVGPAVQILSRIGLAFLFFLAGFELDIQKIKGRPITLAVKGWLLSLGISLGLGFLLQAGDLIISDFVITCALTSTALGILLPILRDEGELDKPFGTYVMAAGAIGEFGPLVMISLLLEKSEHGGLFNALMLVAFTILTLIAAFLAARLRPPYLIQALRKKMHSSAQLPLRAALLILALLVLLTYEFGLDAILGAFAAGMVISLASEGPNRHTMARKLEGMGYGFFIPIFFIASGMSFDLQALFQSASSLLRLPLFLALFLVVRGVPVFIYRKDLPKADLLPLAFLSSTTLPLVMAVTAIGTATGKMRPENAAALMGAAMISVFLFPLLAMILRKKSDHSKATIS